MPLWNQSEADCGESDTACGGNGAGEAPACPWPTALLAIAASPSAARRCAGSPRELLPGARVAAPAGAAWSWPAAALSPELSVLSPVCGFRSVSGAAALTSRSGTPPGDSAVTMDQSSATVVSLVSSRSEDTTVASDKSVVPVVSKVSSRSKDTTGWNSNGDEGRGGPG